MNFTREPIIETVISPKEGYKLVVRSSKGESGEEFVVDAIEVVSFGQSFFYRSQERPKSFLVPVSDYEVVETKETRVVLKNASFERSIKIGGGKEAGMKTQKTEEDPAVQEQRLEKKRERRRHRRKKPSTVAEKTEPEKPADVKGEVSPAEGGGAEDETKLSSSMLRRLIPPPTGLISEKMAREKPPEEVKGVVLPDEPVAEEEKPKKARRKKKSEEDSKQETSEAEEEKPTVEEPPKEEKSSSEEPPAEEGGDINRMATQVEETVTSTSFSTIEEGFNFSPFGKIW